MDSTSESDNTVGVDSSQGTDDVAAPDAQQADTQVADTAVSDTQLGDTLAGTDTATAEVGEDIADAQNVDLAPDIADTQTAELGDDVADAQTSELGADADDTQTSELGADADAAIQPLGALVMEDQVAAKPFTTVFAKAVGLPPGQTAPGKLRILSYDNAGKSTLMGEVAVPAGQALEDVAIVLKTPVVAEQALVAELLQAGSKPVLDVDGEPLTAGFKVVGDTVDPVLVMDNQDLAANALDTLNVSFVRVPDRFTTGLWLAIHADLNGQPGALLGKQKFAVGDHQDVALALTSGLTKGQVLHASLREGAAGTGSWTLSAPIVKDFGGQEMHVTLEVDSAAFHPVLEIEDQTLADPKKLIIQKVTIPKEYFGGWLAIYDDAAGQPGALVGKLYYVTGTKVNQTLSMTVAQQGDKTLHAILYAGQMWDEANNVVMKAPGGSEMKLTFKVGAQSLSYIVAEPYTTKNPRHVMVTRAYSYNKPAWVLLARDDNGKPGTILARKKVLPKFAGNVHLWNLTGDFLEEGTIAEYLQGKPGTFRRYAKGVETLHVMLYEDFPSDNQFTFVPGGSEDVPVLNAVGLDFPECKADIADGLGMQIGEGVRARTHNFGGFHSGFTEPANEELIALMAWKDEKTVWPENQVTIDVGAVMGIHTESRKRRVIGGRYNDTATGIQTVGSGPVLSYPFEVQKGPDGKYYVASYAYVRIDASLVPTVDIIRMDPTTGDREFVWRSNHLGKNLDNQPNPYGHCGNGRTEKFGYESVQIGRKAFGIDPQGNFYLSYAHNGNTPTSDGIGILQVSADGKACNFVTRHKVGADNVLYKGQAIGTGYEAQVGPYKGMLVKNGKLYVSTELNDELLEVDIATGNRTLLHKEGVTDNNTGSTGTHVLWDAQRNLIWQGGLSGATLLFDPAKGTSEPLWCAANDRDYLGIACLKPAAWGNNGMPMERGMWLHPTDKEYMFVVNLSMIQRIHLPSGSSEIFSY